MRTLILFFRLLTFHFWSVIGHFLLIVALAGGGLHLILLGFESHFEPPMLGYSVFGFLILGVAGLFGKFLLLPQVPLMRRLWHSAYVWARLPEPRRTMVIKAQEALVRAIEVMRAHHYLSVIRPEEYASDHQELRLSNSLSPDIRVIIRATGPLKENADDPLWAYGIAVSKTELMNEAWELCHLLSLRVDDWDPLLLETPT